MKRYWVWLSLALGPACPIVHQLMDSFTSAEEIYEHREDVPKMFPAFFNKMRTKRWETTDLTMADPVQ